MADPISSYKRPLSPHLQVYRLPYNALMSIAGRMVGIGLAGTMIAVCAWFIAVIFSPDIFVKTQEFFSFEIVQYLSLAWAAAIFFYIGNGIRHFLWNVGVGLNEKSGILSGNIVLIISLLLTLGVWNMTIGQSSMPQDQDISIEESANE